ncbi:MarR family winged helix-turn-helix transcriptional regulator [Pelosinus sp. UFO1]|uniref:MarR family winged helix-turn-helix transcriptional regulator n=1 Tax=Pelosinus sp. UFO1 TaxID=484770 RepID=UPI0004D15385|nr:MarR family transcriptional regulator [Pelosinus sp. UFO1]AIF49678.1 transcriptional regulator, MarR family [Pelosinus sp. UFO1]
MECSELLLHQLFQTVRIISKGLNKNLESHGIYSSEWSIITTLKEKKSMTQGALASYLNIEPPAVSKSLVKLEQKGLIMRIPGDDKREKKVILTEKAEEQYLTWSQIVGHHRKAILANLSEEKQKEVTTLLKTIFQSAQQYEGL